MDVRADAVAAAVNDIAQVLAEHGDPLDLAHRLVRHCADLLSASAVGLLVEDSDKDLQLLACTSSEVSVIELFQVRTQQGPCIEAYRTGSVVSVATAAELAATWPEFARQAAGVGVVAVHTVPVHSDGRTIGALNLFRDHEGAYSAVESDVAHAMASFGAVGITQLEHVAEGARVQAQLQEALDSRIVLEQAKGALAQRYRVHPDDAFRRLRAQARAERRRLRDVAQEIVDELDRPA
ncbi:GAF domain-containing protein [Kineococcus rhizosphaerae]|uniref:GAF domain-containing protein n=1 Tax=Kineococcus rhizosphaerae TaxID=559628 RepID=A0A2T0R233_9ACTN|nr:GAF domain-containing protein [Kineococcus rhizosphaerae]